MTDERIEILLRSPDPAGLEWAQAPAFFEDYMHYSLAVVDSDPMSGRVYARIACKIAPNNCGRVQAMGLVAQVDRAMGQHDSALARLRNAFLFGENCDACRCDLRRRQAFVKMDQRRFAEALAAANESIQGYTVLTGPDHDLYRNGLASAHMCRGQIHFEAGNLSDSIADISHCLALTDPAVSPALYRVAIFNLAAALASTGKRSDLRLAEKHLRTARRLFQGVQEASQEHAKLAWLTAMVRRELGKARPVRTRDMLEDARRELLKLGFIQEGVAITADMVRMAFPNRRWIRAALAGLREDYRGAQARLPEEIDRALQHVERAVDAHDIGAVRALKASVEGLREACGPKMLACLVTWRPAF